MAGKLVALDTNGWFALLNRQDRLHELAVSTFADILRTGGKLLVTDWIISETGNGLARTPARQSFRSAVATVLNDPRSILVMIDERRMRQAIDRYDERPDRSWGLVDCSKMLIMEEFGATEAFTSDQHFQQAGFVALLQRDRGG
jgi:predicted nucleic acid-binding protein